MQANDKLPCFWGWRRGRNQHVGSLPRRQSRHTSAQRSDHTLFQVHVFAIFSLSKKTSSFSSYRCGGKVELIWRSRGKSWQSACKVCIKIQHKLNSSVLSAMGAQAFCLRFARKARERKFSKSKVKCARKKYKRNVYEQNGLKREIYIYINIYKLSGNCTFLQWAR